MHIQHLWYRTLISDESQKLAINGGLGCSIVVARETMSISSYIKTKDTNANFVSRQRGNGSE